LLISCGVDPALGLYIYGPHGLLYQQNVPYAEDTADVHIEILHGRLTFYLNRYDGGEVPLYAVSYPDLSSRDLRPYFFDNNSYNQLTNRVQGRIQRHYLYTAAQQTTDFGSTQTTQYWNIYRVDPRVGRGYPAKVTLVR
jgi:hypothetical protein